MNLEGLKVMVIDDSKTIRRTAETLLKKEGEYEVVIPHSIVLDRVSW